MDPLSPVASRSARGYDGLPRQGIMNRFIDETVDVTVSGELHLPSCFSWRGEDFEIMEILQQWSDWHFGEGSHRRSWRNRRHRNYYRVRTAKGDYELYLDRNAPSEHPVWILYQELLPEATDPSMSDS